MMDKISQECFGNEISVKKVRLILSFKFRVGKTNTNLILNDMKRLGLIEYKNHKVIVILYKPIR